MGFGVCSTRPNHTLPRGSSCTIATEGGYHSMTRERLDLHCIMRHCADFVTWQHTSSLSIQSKLMLGEVVITVHWQRLCTRDTSSGRSCCISMVEQSMLRA